MNKCGWRRSTIFAMQKGSVERQVVEAINDIFFAYDGQARTNQLSWFYHLPLRIVIKMEDWFIRHLLSPIEGSKPREVPLVRLLKWLGYPAVIVMFVAWNLWSAFLVAVSYVPLTIIYLLLALWPGTDRRRRDRGSRSRAD